MKRFAVIDIGSNSVRLMFVADGKILYKRLLTTRLGEGIAHSPYLKEEAIERTATAVASFFGQAKGEGAEEVYAFATAAVRSAQNRLSFLERVEGLCGLKVEVIAGETEAEIGLLGALGEEDGGVIDIGGASTEIVVKKQSKIVYKKSVDLGVVRLKDECENIAALYEKAKEKAPFFEGVPTDTTFYGIGGTATTIASQYLRLDEYDGERVTGTVISVEELQRLVDEFAAMSVEQIATLPCMPNGRSDVIVGGMLWLVTLMQYLKIPALTISDRDNLEGYAVKKGLL